ASPRRREPVRPSETAARIPARLVFQLDAASPADFGRELHALLAAVEWGGVAGWPAARSETAAASEALACLRSTALADVWKKPAGGEVWRERAFEIVLDD